MNKVKTSFEELVIGAKVRLKNVNNYNNKNIINSNSRKSSQLINFQTVIEILNSNEVIENPIQRLINKEYYDTLNETAKQRYILHVVEDYLSIKKRYMEQRNYIQNSIGNWTNL